MLMSLLNLRQDRFTKSLDIPSLLTSHLGIEMPARGDYLAGGKLACEYTRSVGSTHAPPPPPPPPPPPRPPAHSYYRDVHTAAIRVLAAGVRYLAVRNHLQVVYHHEAQPSRAADGDGGGGGGGCGDGGNSGNSAGGSNNAGDTREVLERMALAAVRAADAAGCSLNFGPEAKPPSGGGGKRSTAHDDYAGVVELYEKAFAACRALVHSDPASFTAEGLMIGKQEEDGKELAAGLAGGGRGNESANWLKIFMHRSYEALMVESVVRNCEQRVDRVLEWVAYQTGTTPLEVARLVVPGGAPPGGAGPLVELVIDALYHNEDDRRTLKRDPLVRLLLNNPAGAMYSDFTIVLAAGVVTDGAKGRELEGAFGRLKAQRGVQVVRADTATAREFTYNAARIEDAVRQVTTRTWGWLGYSQGCANALTAESTMRGGTPEQRKLLDGLRSRHLLFGAHNGSAHADCGEYSRAGNLERREDRPTSPPIVLHRRSQG